MNLKSTLATPHSALLAALLAALAPGLRAAEISWWSFTGGGGISEHGGLALGGALGPIAPALAPATGGDYTLTGGFWPALAGQPARPAPVLRITALGNGETVRLAWPVTVSGYALESTTQLGAGVWEQEAAAVEDTATEHTVTVKVEALFRCYRLKRQ